MRDQFPELVWIWQIEWFDGEYHHERWLKDAHVEDFEGVHYFWFAFYFLFSFKVDFFVYSVDILVEIDDIFAKFCHTREYVFCKAMLA